MKDQNETTINWKSINYDIQSDYHSDLQCQNYTAKISGVQESDGRISVYPDFKSNTDYLHPQEFTFFHSDPDRVIAVAKMIQAFAETVKENNKKTIDISEKTC